MADKITPCRVKGDVAGEVVNAPHRSGGTSIIPEGWAVLALAQVVEIGRKICYGIVQPGEHTPAGIPLIRGRDYSFGWAPLEDFYRVSEEIDRPYRRSKVRPNDLLLTIVGAGTGNVAVVPNWLDGANITQTTARIAVDARHHDFRFVRALLESVYGRRAVHRAIKGGAQPGLNIGDVELFEFMLPPLREQRRIADVLGTWDRAIETVELLLANTRVQKRGLLHSLLTGRNRLKGFSGDWRREPLGKLCQISKGEQLGRLAMLADGSVPVINGGVGPSGYTDKANNPGGCITVSEGGNSCGFVSLIGEPFWCGGHCYALKALTVDRSFLFAFLKHREAEIMKLRVGSGLPNIQKKDFARFEILVPSRAEQEAIGELADTQDSEIQRLESQLAGLRREKAALMQQLLTGKRRLKVDQKEAA